MRVRYAYSQGGIRRVAARIFSAMVGFIASAGLAEEPLKIAGTQLEPVTWTELAGWTADDHLAAFAAYQRSCQALLRRRRSDDKGPIQGALWNVCQKAIGIRPSDTATARTFFEDNFEPVRIARLGEADGLLTGYFEPVVQGSRFPNREFHFPLYRRPPDLVAAGHKPGSVAFPNKGRIGRRNEKNQLVPYYDRAAIEAGALDGQKLEICWLKDPLDVFAIQLEGSGRVILEDGTPLRVNYDSHNGYPFSSITQELVKRSLMAREQMSTQRIRDWMAANPEEAAKVRATNRSYVFFRITGLANEDDPVGGQGVRLTPGRSIAVDRQHEYGTPFFIEANLPINNPKFASRFNRLVVAQDTGSAIVGPARADLYWGSGDEAGRIASRIRHRGRFVMLLPRELDMIAAGSHMPLPQPRPRASELALKNQSKRNLVAVRYDEHRPAGTTSVPRAISARTSPSRARCVSCLVQPDQTVRAASDCCGLRTSSKNPTKQKSNAREFPDARPRGSELVVSTQNKQNVGVVRYDEHRTAATTSVPAAVPARTSPSRAPCLSCVVQPDQTVRTASDCCGPRTSGKNPAKQKSNAREFRDARPRGSELVVSTQNKQNVGVLRYDEHRPAATTSVPAAIPARLLPSRARCLNCLVQSDQTRRAARDCCGPSASDKNVAMQKSSGKELPARLGVGPNQRFRDSGNKRAPVRILSPLQAAKPITRPTNL